MEDAIGQPCREIKRVAADRHTDSARRYVAVGRDADKSKQRVQQQYRRQKIRERIQRFLRADVVSGATRAGAHSNVVETGEDAAPALEDTCHV